MVKQLIKITGVCGAIFLSASACFAAGARVTYPDGQPVVGARVNVHLQEVDKFTVKTDTDGRFVLPAMDFLDAFVQIKAPDGDDYATVNLPVALFDSGEIAVVLQPKR